MPAKRIKVIRHQVKYNKILMAFMTMTIDRLSHTKFLGILIDENLTWKYHIDCVSKILSRNIGIMNKLEYFVPDRMSHSLYCTSSLPYINFGILI